MKSKLTIRGQIMRLVNDSISADRTTQKVMNLVEEFTHEYAQFAWPDYMTANEGQYVADYKILLTEFKQKQIQLRNEKQVDRHPPRAAAIQSPEDSSNPILARYLYPEIPGVTESE